VVLTFGGDRQYGGNTGYEDRTTEYYSYDSFVANHLQVASGDVAIVCDRGFVVGAETVTELVALLNAGTAWQHLLAKSILRRLKSSPAAIEGSLARIREARNRAAHAMAPMDGSAGDEFLDDEPNGYIDPSVMVEAGPIASRALDILEESGSDSKVATLAALLEHINAAKTSSTRVCVLTEFVATVFYLAAEIESRGQACQVFHGGMPADERQRTLSLFASEGGVLVATRGVVSGSVSLSEVTDLVLYDTPGSLAALQSVLGRVDRFGRTAQLNIQVLVPSYDVAGGDIESLELLRRVVTARGSEQAEKFPEEG
jgi:hypothetical protein